MEKLNLNDHSSRAHALLSASSAARWLACPPSAVIADSYPSTDTVYTMEGTLAHEVAELVARGTVRPKNVIECLDHDPTQEMVDCAVGYCNYIQELKKSDDASVLLEQRVDFSAWVPGGFGTADCILIGDKKSRSLTINTASAFRSRP